MSASQTGGQGASAGEALGAVLAALGPVLDVVDGVVDDAEPPEWCRRRGWDGFLLGLDAARLDACERGDAARLLGARPGVPLDLAELARAVDRLTRLPRFASSPVRLPAPALRGVAARKHEQLAVLLAVIGPMAARAARVVDVGAGRGHFARLSAELFGRPALAVERDAVVARAGAAGAAHRERDVGALPLTFVVTDACVSAPYLERADLAVGLHACGELGDRLVVESAAAGCDLALISCCLQKIRAPARAALSRAGAPLVLRRAALGLTNLTAQPVGVEGGLASWLAARETRLALRKLLRARGVELAAGEEMRGVNRRRAHAGLAALAARVLAARGLPPASAREIDAHARAAQRDHAIVRRLSLPRHLLARLVELAVVLDRATFLEEQGRFVRVATLFARAVSPRNLALAASAERRRLPRVA
ncbi:MAG TPA: methyltransferase [Polyangia bacterium]|jgi:SAM-dependent methyltransferase